MILFCDIDGTLTETISGETFKRHPHDVKIISGADNAIADFVKSGYKCVGVSNQGGVGAGHKSLEDAIAEMKYTQELFPDLEKILFCPDFEGRIVYQVCVGIVSTNGGSNFRKPGAGMIEFVLKHQPIKIDKQACLMVGDRPEDERCAFNAGVNFITADVWRNTYRTVR